MWKDYSRRKICNLLHKCDIKGNYSDPSIPFPRKKSVQMVFLLNCCDTVQFNVFCIHECFRMFCITLQIYVHESIYSIFFSLSLSSTTAKRAASCKQFWGKTLHNNKFSCVYFSPGCFFLSFCRNVSTAHIFSHLKHEILIFLCMCECDCVRKCIQTQTQEEY